MDLTGNSCELSAGIVNSTGRSFTGSHGDGSLSTDGYANNSDWPGYVTSKVTGATGVSISDYAWFWNDTDTLSSRVWAISPEASLRRYLWGIRCARTAP